MSKARELEQRAKRSTAQSAVFSALADNIERGAEYETMVEWIEKCDIKTSSGKPFELEDHKFLIDIMEDDYPWQVCPKAAQIGVSEAKVLQTYRWVKKNKWNVIYTLPTQGNVELFVDSKVAPILENNPSIGAFVVSERKEMRKIGNHFIFYRGTEKEKEGIMLSADRVVHDELDRSTLKNISTFESRIAGASESVKGIHYFSNPSFPGQGVDEYWRISDQRHWMVKCSERAKGKNGKMADGCGREWYLSWPDSVDMDAGVYRCQRCGKEITRGERINGRWVARYPGRKFHGYWVNHMMAGWITCPEIIEAFRKKDRPYFWNMVMGQPYVGSDDTVNRSMLTMNVAGEKEFAIGPISGGCDQGDKIKHIVIGQPNGLTSLHMVPHFLTRECKEGQLSVQQIIEKYRPSTFVIDGLPQTAPVRELQEMFPFVVFSSYYRQDWRRDEPFQWDEKKRTVNSSRHRVLDELVREISEGKFKFFYGMHHKPEWETFCKHWETMYRTEQDIEGNKRPIWSAAKDDHFVHAMNLWRLAVRRTETITPLFSSKDPKQETNPLDVPDAFTAMMEAESTPDWYSGV